MNLNLNEMAMKERAQFLEEEWKKDYFNLVAWLQREDRPGERTEVANREWGITGDFWTLKDMKRMIEEMSDETLLAFADYKSKNTFYGCETSRDWALAEIEARGIKKS